MSRKTATLELEEQGHKCQNCGKVFGIDDLLAIEDFGQRVTAGEPCPSGECPECRALCQPTGKPLPPLTDVQYIHAARRLHASEGEVEIDDDLKVLSSRKRVSRSSDNGAYVVAWVWVPNSEARKEKN